MTQQQAQFDSGYTPNAQCYDDPPPTPGRDTNDRQFSSSSNGKRSRNARTYGHLTRKQRERAEQEKKSRT
eukprot:2056114-Rhodomonas_salina.1